MIVRTQVSFSVSGERFMPSKVPATFSDAHDPGVIGKLGRYRGAAVPYGSAGFHAPEEEKSKLAWIYDRVLPFRAAMQDAGAEHFTLSVTYTYDSQCALSFTKEELKMILELDCDFHVDCEVAPLMKEEPNQSPEPTAMLVTPRAEPRVAPSTAVAHL